MNRIRIQVGDMIRIERFGYNHVGIYVGPRGPHGHDVVHNDKGIGVVSAFLNDFADGSTVFLHKSAPDDALERELIAQRAWSMIGRKFDLFNFNCEHAANLAQSGREQSEQLQTFGGIAFVGLVIAAGLAFGSGRGGKA